MGTGSVYLFDGAGTQLARLTAADGAASHGFGFSVAISSDGSRVAVVAHSHNASTGSVYLFDVAGTQLAKLTAADGAENGLFGSSVAISSDGSRVAVGASEADDKGPSSGSVYLFE